MLKIIFLIILTSLLTVISQIFLKKGFMGSGEIKIDNFSELVGSLSRLIQEKYFLVGAFFALMAAFIWLIIVSKKDLTIVFPIAGGIFYILLFLFSWLFLGENITLWKLLGTIIIFLGISMFFIK